MGVGVLKIVSNQYIRNFSEIGHLQEKSTIFYNLVESKGQKGRMYGVELVYRCEGEGCEDSITAISHSRRSAIDIITYLYENAIKIGNWRDIVADIFGEQIQRMD
jgi:hypothetical protein